MSKGSRIESKIASFDSNY